MFGGIKKIILWNYERGTWPYDILCLLIIAFIFLTPNEWFRKQEKSATNSMTVIVKAADVDQNRLESGIREITGHSEAKVLSVKRREDNSGQEILEVEVEHGSGQR
jgi:hypothetical protein